MGLSGEDLPLLLPRLHSLTLHSAALGGNGSWAGLPLLSSITSVAVHVRDARPPPPDTPLAPAIGGALGCAAPGGTAGGLRPAGLGPALVPGRHARWAALMACPALAELAVGVNPYEAARLPELPPGAWRQLKRLRLTPNSIVAWPKPGVLPGSWCALPALRALNLGGEWRLPWGLSGLSALEELEVEKLAGLLKPLVSLAALTRLVIREAHAQVRFEKPTRRCGRACASRLWGKGSFAHAAGVIRACRPRACSLTRCDSLSRRMALPAGDAKGALDAGDVLHGMSVGGMAFV